jgi:hypothetical protein
MLSPDVIHQQPVQANMSGLASKWATEKQLVDSPQSQDKAKPAPDQNTKIDPLPSKWASVVSEPKKATLQPSSSRPPTVPATTNAQSKDSHKSKHRAGRKSRSSERANGARREPEAASNPRMTDAAKSFASRLGALSIDETKAPQEFKAHHDGPNRGRAKTGHGAMGHPPVEGKGESKNTTTKGKPNAEEHWVDEEKPAALMSAAGQTLAARLGMSPATSTSPTTANVPRSSTTAAASSTPSQGGQASKYLTPRQKRQQEERELKERKEREKRDRRKIEDAAEREKQAKIKQEVSEMFSKLTDKHADWADIDDEDF